MALIRQPDDSLRAASVTLTSLPHGSFSPSLFPFLTLLFEDMLMKRQRWLALPLNSILEFSVAWNLLNKQQQQREQLSQANTDGLRPAEALKVCLISFPAPALLRTSPTIYDQTWRQRMRWSALLLDSHTMSQASVHKGEEMPRTNRMFFFHFLCPHYGCFLLSFVFNREQLQR